MTDAAAVQAGLSRSGSTVAWQIMGDLLGLPVCKTHEYIDYGELPVVVTVRHPVDAVASLARVNPATDPVWVVGNTATEMMKFHERHKGPLLVLKYESWWPDLANCVTQIADFLDVRIGSEDYGRIIHRRNMAANKEIADRVGVWESHDPETLIHGNHIGSGRPDGRDALTASQRLTAARVMGEFMHYFGYEL